MPDLSLPETIACPICLAPMTTLSTGPCDVDVCRKCGGIWFDKDELRRLSRENPRAPTPGLCPPQASNRPPSNPLPGKRALNDSNPVLILV